jgi:RNA polymerase sigma-70 factor (ECF subfamily)
MSTRRKVLPTIPYSAELLEPHNGIDSMVAQPLIAGQARDDELEWALAQLEESQRQVVALRFYADLSLEEIAEVIGVPIGTVKSRLHRALAKLREQLLRPKTASKREIMP